MIVELWSLPVPPTALVGGPDLMVKPRRKCELLFAIEDGDGGRIRWMGIRFLGVEVYKCTHMTSLWSVDSIALRRAYGALVSIGDSEMLKDVSHAYREYCQLLSLELGDLIHLMINFDDGPCYEFICLGFEILAELPDSDRP